MNILGHLFPTPPKVRVARVAQITDSHCGPAVVQLLFSHLDRQVTQDEVVTAARVRSRLEAHGTRPDHLARAVAKLAPDLQFWFKQHATIHDLEVLIDQHHYPVAVNWQGLFYDTEEEQERENPGGDHGHYSAAIDIDVEKDKITLADPYSEYAHKPRVFSLKWFQKRWWDVDHDVIRVSKSHQRRNSIKTKRLIFIVTPKDADFPLELGMKPGNEINMSQFNPGAAR